MATVEVDFEVFKALTIRRATESTTYNDVIRDLLGLPHRAGVGQEAASAVFDGVQFPNGTLFQKTYKGRTYKAQISDGRWLGDDGHHRRSPSDAAMRITGNNVNGWRFWRCRRPWCRRRSEANRSPGCFIRCWQRPKRGKRRRFEAEIEATEHFGGTVADPRAQA